MVLRNDMKYPPRYNSAAFIIYDSELLDYVHFRDKELRYAAQLALPRIWKPRPCSPD